jgi:hypothetical protein
VWSYSYDALGRRILKRGPDREIRDVWDRDVIIHELEGDSRRTWFFVPDSFVPLGTVQGGSSTR